MAPERTTVVINLIAGPGAGKTICAWEIAEKLKKQGYIAEYVSEIAKEYVWEERFDLLDGSLVHQKALLDISTSGKHIGKWRLVSGVHYAEKKWKSYSTKDTGTWNAKTVSLPLVALLAVILAGLIADKRLLKRI